MLTYKRLGITEREEISRHIAMGTSTRQIAKLIRRSLYCSPLTGTGF